jgi:sugar (pentulose or hexulose) kinase
MLAAVGAGIYEDIPAAAEKMVHTADTIEPDPGRHEEYGFYVDRYLETYPQMKELMHKTERHVAGGEAGA